MTEPAVLLCTVPVLYIGRDNDYIAAFKASGGFALFNIPAAACGADKYLSAALGGVMDMPVVAARRLKGHICQKYG